MSNWLYPHIATHCDGGKLAPENTPTVIDVGARCGHTMVEPDAKLSKDGQIFLLHDDNLERTSNGWGAVGELAWDDLLKVDTGGWFNREFRGESLPLFPQVTERCHHHGMTTNIEAKPTTGLGPQAGNVMVLVACDLWQGMITPLLSSFKIGALEVVQRAAPELSRELLLNGWRDDQRELTIRLGCVSIYLNHKLLDAAQVANLRQAGLHTLMYTANKSQHAAELLRWGVDCICTDTIDVIGSNFHPQNGSATADLRVGLPQHFTAVVRQYLLWRIEIAALGRTLLIHLQPVLQISLLRADLTIQVLS